MRGDKIACQYRHFMLDRKLNHGWRNTTFEKEQSGTEYGHMILLSSRSSLS